MNRLTLLTIATGALAAISTQAATASELKIYDGGMATGGGGAIVCRDANFQVVRAELYDLFEARVRTGRTIIKSTTDANEQARALLRALGPDSFLGHGLANRLDEATQRVRFIPTDYKLKAPEDLGRDWGVILPIGCELEGAAYFNEDGTIDIARGVYDKFSETDRAALFLHEVIYWYGRDYKQVSRSTLVRSLVAWAFSTDFDATQWSTQADEEMRGQVGKRTAILRPSSAFERGIHFHFSVTNTAGETVPFYSDVTYQTRGAKNPTTVGSYPWTISDLNPDFYLDAKTKITWSFHSVAGRSIGNPYPVPLPAETRLKLDVILRDETVTLISTTYSQGDSQIRLGSIDFEARSEWTFNIPK